MVRALVFAAALSGLCGCGLGTAVSAGSSTEAQQAQQANAMEKQVQKELDEAAQTAAAQRRAAEAQ